MEQAEEFSLLPVLLVRCAWQHQTVRWQIKRQFCRFRKNILKRSDWVWFRQHNVFRAENNKENGTREILNTVYEALVEKGYDPINQIVGYLLSGDPAYITSHKNARTLIRQMERDELVEELVRSYLKK